MRSYKIAHGAEGEEKGAGVASVKGGRGEPAWSDERGSLAVSLSGV